MSEHGKNPINSFLGFFDKFGLNSVWIVVVLGFVMMIVTLRVTGIDAARWLGILFFTSPLWLPYLLFPLAYRWWLIYVQTNFDIVQGRTTLEIIFPQDVFKSPHAMELVLAQLYQTASPDNHYQTYWDGKHPPKYGLEIVSDGGRVHFYVSTPTKKFKNMWESQLYAQYPGIIIKELETDYTASVPWDPKKYYYFAIHYKLDKPDAYPIKTYIDYGLDKDPKEEYKIDPLTPMLEYLGSLKAGEKYWVQFLISAHRKEDFKVGSLRTFPNWTEGVRAEINKLAQRDTDKKGTPEFESAPRVTPGERDIISSMERKLSKWPFNVQIRTMYIAEWPVAQPGERIGPMVGFWRHMEDLNRNGIRIKWRTDFDWNWWQDPKGHHAAHYKHEELHEYKLRSWTRRTGDDVGFILTTEELATLFHPAGQVLLTPTLERVPSARAEAPSNLPRIQS